MPSTTTGSSGPRRQTRVSTLCSRRRSTRRTRPLTPVSRVRLVPFSLTNSQARVLEWKPSPKRRACRVSTQEFTIDSTWWRGSSWAVARRRSRLPRISTRSRQAPSKRRRREGKARWVEESLPRLFREPAGATVPGHHVWADVRDFQSDSPPRAGSLPDFFRFLTYRVLEHTTGRAGTEGDRGTQGNGRPRSDARFRLPLLQPGSTSQRLSTWGGSAAAPARGERRVRDRGAGVQRFHAGRTEERDRLGVAISAAALQRQARAALVRVPIDGRR